MGFPEADDFNQYKGTVLTLIANNIINLKVDYRVTEFYGEKDRPCSVEVRDKLQTIAFSKGSALKRIQNYAFCTCSKLQGIDLSLCEELETIDEQAFYDCPLMTTVTFPTTKLTTIGIKAFSYTGVINVFIPRQVKFFNSAAFRYCSSLVTLEFDVNSEVTTLPKYTVSDTGVTSFTVRKNITKITSGAFEAANCLLSIIVDEENTKYCSMSNALFNKEKTTIISVPLGLTGEYTVPEGVKTLGSLSLYTSKFTKVNLPDSLTVVGDYSLGNSRELTEIVIPENVTIIRQAAFRSCTKLSSVTLSKNLKTISEEAFEYCSFAKIVIPEGVTTIGANAFARNTALKEVILPSTITYLGGGVFPENKGIDITFSGNSTLKLTNDLIIMDKSETFISQYMGSKENFILDVPKTIKIIQKGAFMEKTNLIEVSFTADSELIEIQADAFYGCKNLGVFSFPEKLTTIGNSAFGDCEKIEEVVFKSNLETIGYKGFYSCDNLRLVNLQNTKINTLSESVFSSCQRLTTVSLPANEISFQKDCFRDCLLLKTISNLENAKVTFVDEYSFSKTKIESFSFPAESTVTNIGRYAFYKCEELSSVTFCKSIASIGYCSFAFTKLTEVVLSEGITSLSDSSFSSCKYLTSFRIPENCQLTEGGIVSGIFRNCSAFSTIECNSTNFEVSIGALFAPDFSALLIFPPASQIKYLPIPDRVTRIGNGAFIDCYNLYSVIIPQNSVTTIGSNAFEGCTNLHYINIPATLEAIGDKIFIGCTNLKCGVDIDLTEKQQIMNKLFAEGNLPRNSVDKCNNITCRINGFSRFNSIFALTFSILFLN